jgi:cullin 3
LQVQIKAPRKLTSPHADTFERLANAVKEIQHKNASRLSFEEHYRYAYTLVLHKQGQLLYDGIKSLVTDHLEAEAHARVAPSFPTMSLDDGDLMEAQASGQQGEKFLNALRGVWDDHTACMSKLKDLLKYMVSSLV